jgi:hypothetical protein
MKKLFVIFMISGLAVFSACNGKKADEVVVEDSTATEVVVEDSVATEEVVVEDSTSAGGAVEGAVK